MGVHTTFVRSVDLDEWTQRQIDSMRLGGNGNARNYFRKYGFTDFHGQVDKKYKSKAAQSYRVELIKLMDAEAVKRGEAVATAAAIESNGLDSLSPEQQQDDIARQKLAEARAANSAPAQSKAVLASQLSNTKGKLATPPSSGNAPKLVSLKKTSNLKSLNMLTKKTSSGGGGSKLRINKLSAQGKTVSSTSTSDDEGFEDIGATQKNSAETAVSAAQIAEDERIARKMQMEMDNGFVAAALVPVVVPIVVPVAPKPVAVPKKAPVLETKKSSMETGMAKLQAMNSDFFSDM